MTMPSHTHGILQVCASPPGLSVVPLAPCTAWPPCCDLPTQQA